jgi:hypothetical protein
MSNKMYTFFAAIVTMILFLAPQPGWIIDVDKFEALQKEQEFLDNLPIYRSAGATDDIKTGSDALLELGIDDSIFTSDLSNEKFEEVWNMKKMFNMINVDHYANSLLLWAIAIKLTILFILGGGLYISYKFDTFYRKLKEDELNER